MQVQCTCEREQVCAVVDAHNCAKPMEKERKPADCVQLSIESISYSTPYLANYKVINLALQIHILAKGIMHGLMVLE